LFSPPAPPSVDRTGQRKVSTTVLCPDDTSTRNKKKPRRPQVC
jgi:hypothetical protein